MSALVPRERDELEVGRAALHRLEALGARLVTVGGVRGVAIRSKDYSAEFREDLRILGLGHLCVFSPEWDLVRNRLGLRPPTSSRPGTRRGAT